MIATVLSGLLNCIKNPCPVYNNKRSFVGIILVLIFYACTGKYMEDNNFDYILLSQRWPVTACIEYMEKNSSSTALHFCKLPENYKMWLIHGLWPTQDKHIGPFFCNMSMPFDIHKIEPIESNLKLYWPNIEGGKSVSSLWKHEWEKHGTCAAQLKSLNNEFKYFNTAMKLYKMNNIKDIFVKYNIIASLNLGLNVSYLFYLIKNAFGVLPQIHCIHVVNKRQMYLSEIRTCFNKNLELINCKNIKTRKMNNKSSYSDLTNCPNNETVIFPDKIDPGLNDENLIRNTESTVYYNKLYNILNFVKFLQWASM